MGVCVYGIVLLFKEMYFIEITNTSKIEKSYIYSFKKNFKNRNYYFTDRDDCDKGRTLDC